ncbi:hypothetical protein OS493_035614 [Desmophyllum pertusum]|uniref:Uncharacterized protein n=1 Tax=Desmophyllum pertusum TaxID=174260 RepID=A0A9W9ZIJ9_9CNID|nr:hypothetical protein OS493_035614 [Desmophyllum pertusum]
MCVQWLNKWLGQFRQHIRSLAGKISRAQAGSVVKGTKTPKTPSSIKGILKTDRTSSQRTASEMSKPASISFDVEALGGRAADTAAPAEAINYFCEIRMERNWSEYGCEHVRRLLSRPRTTPGTRCSFCRKYTANGASRGWRNALQSLSSRKGNFSRTSVSYAYNLPNPSQCSVKQHGASPQNSDAQPIP